MRLTKSPSLMAFRAEIIDPRIFDDTMLEAGEVESKRWWAGESSERACASGQEVRGLSSEVTRSRGRASPARAAPPPERAASRGGVGFGEVHPGYTDIYWEMSASPHLFIHALKVRRLPLASIPSQALSYCAPPLVVARRILAAA